MAKTSPISIAFGQAVKQERSKQNVTQVELAERCGVDRTYLSRIERGLKNPTLSVVWDIASKLNINLLTLMMETVQNLPIDFYQQAKPANQDHQTE
jgi:transcriptional regulator with XRE-family HTH domain